jgi:hypothetical protein
MRQVGLDARSEGRVTTAYQAPRGVLSNLAPRHRYVVRASQATLQLAVVLLEELAHTQIGQCSGITREHDVPEPVWRCGQAGWRPTAVAMRLAGSSSATA